MGFTGVERKNFDANIKFAEKHQHIAGFWINILLMDESKVELWGAASHYVCWR